MAQLAKYQYKWFETAPILFVPSLFQPNKTAAHIVEYQELYRVKVMKKHTRLVPFQITRRFMQTRLTVGKTISIFHLILLNFKENDAIYTGIVLQAKYI